MKKKTNNLDVLKPDFFNGFIDTLENKDSIISRKVFEKIDLYIQKTAKVHPQMDVIPNSNAMHLDGHFIFSVRN